VRSVLFLGKTSHQISCLSISNNIHIDTALLPRVQAGSPCLIHPFILQLHHSAATTKWAHPPNISFLHHSTMASSSLSDPSATKRVKTDPMNVDTSASDAEFAELEAQLRAFDEKREVVIKKSRDVQKAAKQAIYALQRNDLSKANELIKQCEKVSQPELFDLVNKDPDLRYGSFANCLEEYAEAVIFRDFIQSKGVTPLSIKSIALPLTADEYLGGLMDCCGEVQRRAVLSATKGHKGEVERARDYVDYVMGRMMLFELRNGSLRKKSDTIKWVLKRIEEVLFDLSVGGRLREEGPQAPPAASADGDGGTEEWKVMG